MKTGSVTFLSLLLAACCSQSPAQVIMYGDADVLGTGTYSADPTALATLSGLGAGASTFGGPEVSHGFPFMPDVNDFAGTDQIFTSSAQSATGDGYSGFAGRLAGPQTLFLDYSSLVGTDQTIDTFTLGIAADDFQFSLFGQPFTASINGVANSGLTAVLNGLTQTGPQVQFFTIGLDASTLDASHLLTLAIDQDGDGRDGWAIDFLTVGVTTVPEPSALALLSVFFCIAAWRQARH